MLKRVATNKIAVRTFLGHLVDQIKVASFGPLDLCQKHFARRAVKILRRKRLLQSNDVTGG